MIKVSVIVPVYNMERKVEKCLESLLSQTLKEIEIIAVDDGSTDSSPKLLKEYEKKYEQIRYVHKENGGISDARNFGNTFAQGEYIGYVDSDDYVDPDMFEVMYNRAKEKDSDIVECNLRHTFADGEDIEIMDKIYTPQELLCFGRYVVWNKIYRREWLLATKTLFPTGLIYEEISFLSKLFPYAKNYEYVDIAPVHYVQRRESLNNKSSIRTLQIFTILKDVSDFYKERGLYKDYEPEMEYLYARILLCSSFSRMCRIPEADIRRRALRENWELLVNTYPAWRKNAVLRRTKTSRAFYMRTVNALTYRIYAVAFRLVHKIGQRSKGRWVA